MRIGSRVAVVILLTFLGPASPAGQSAIAHAQTCSLPPGAFSATAFVDILELDGSITNNDESMLRVRLRGQSGSIFDMCRPEGVGGCTGCNCATDDWGVLRWQDNLVSHNLMQTLMMAFLAGRKVTIIGTSEPRTAAQHRCLIAGVLVE